MIVIHRNRVVDWQSLFYDKLEQPVEFEWGKTDCLLYLCEVVQVISGIDYADEVRGTYHNEEEADALIAKWGAISNYLTYRTRHLPLEHVMMAQMGDLVTLRDGDVESVGVANGWRAVFINHSPGKGLRSIRLDMCDKAWPT